MDNKMLKYLKYRNFTLIFILSLISSFVFLTKTFAQERREHTERREHIERMEHPPVRVSHQPQNYMGVVVGSRRYFYNGGSFYIRARGGYNVVAAPIGAMIRVLPEGFVSLRIGEMDYYCFNGIYYNYLPDQACYVVVEKPAGADNVVDLKLDQVKMYDGTTVEGVFQGATDSTITLKVGDNIRDINISDIISITFAPPTNDNSAPK
jgi:hypothetical protein